MKNQNIIGFLSARNYIKEKRDLENNILFLKSRTNFTPRINKDRKKKISIYTLLQNLHPEKKVIKQNKFEDSKILGNKLKSVDLSYNKDKTIFDIIGKDFLSKSIFHNEFLNNQYFFHKSNDSMNYKKKRNLNSNQKKIKELYNKKRINSVDNIHKIVNKSTNTGFNDIKNAYYLVYNNNVLNKNRKNSIYNYINNFKNKNLKNSKKTNNIKNKYLRYIENNLLKNRANYILNNISPNRGGKESLRKLYNPMAI
jgi:hypothetical protein